MGHIGAGMSGWPGRMALHRPGSSTGWRMDHDQFWTRANHERPVLVSWIVTRGRVPVHDAEDIVQEMFVYLLGGRPPRYTRYDPARGSLLTWLIWVARSQVFRYRRRARMLCRGGGGEFSRQYGTSVSLATETPDPTVYNPDEHKV